VTGGWRKLRNEALHKLIIRLIMLEHKLKEAEIEGPCSTRGRSEKYTHNFVRNTSREK